MDVLGGSASGGGGKGAILSDAAAAAAAEAYFRTSPGGRVGTAAGFIWLVDPFVRLAGVCSVANAGRGLLSCVEGLRAAATGGSGIALAFPLGMLPDRESISGASSCIDCVSCDDTRSLSLFMP